MLVHLHAGLVALTGHHTQGPPILQVVVALGKGFSLVANPNNSSCLLGSDISYTADKG